MSPDDADSTVGGGRGGAKGGSSEVLTPADTRRVLFWVTKIFKHIHSQIAQIVNSCININS